MLRNLNLIKSPIGKKPLQINIRVDLVFLAETT